MDDAPVDGRISRDFGGHSAELDKLGTSHLLSVVVSFGITVIRSIAGSPREVVRAAQPLPTLAVDYWVLSPNRCGWTDQPEKRLD